MPKIRPGMKKPPAGFDVISAKLDEYEEQMHLAIQEESTGVVGETSKKRNRDNKTKNVNKDNIKRSKMEEYEGDDDDIDSLNKEDTNTEIIVKDDNVNDSNEVETTNKPIPPLWKIAQINAARTRYVFDAFYRHHHISREVFDYCCEMHFIDAGLAKRWKLPGYEKLCCNACALPGAASLAAARNAKYAHRHSAERKSSTLSSNKNNNNISNASSTCICRVPASQRKNKSFLACSVCGCTGCCSSDVTKSKE